MASRARFNLNGQSIEEVLPSAIGTPIAMLGGALMVAALCLLFYIVSNIMQFIDDPAQVGVMKYITADAAMGDKAFYGTTGDKSFEFNVSPQLRNVGYVTGGVMVFAIMSGIFNGLIVAGATLVRLGISGRMKWRGGSDPVAGGNSSADTGQSSGQDPYSSS